jgi:hypothetical protein
MEDKGHKKLVKDLRKLLDEAEKYEFHDFKNTSYPAPKMTLADRLRVMRRDTLNGVYDN